NVFNQCSAIARRLGPMDHERALIIGDPSIDHAMFSLPELPSAFREAELIGTLYNPATVLTGDMVRKADVCVGMGRADVIHLAMHYVVDERSPMLSEFLLAKQKNNMGKGSLEEEVLRAYELYGLRLPHTRLVVLAACQTAVERFYGGEGALSISRPFLMAGVPLVLSTLWSVDSTNTVDLMVAFHTYRKTAGLTTVAALRQSQLDTLNGPDERSRRPYYWAAFVVMGGHAKF
ncbi:MAG TPA: CHAT domain-containing protein, partial [Blastocatellia bacterium]